jgi:hypothetical protein
MGVVGRTTIIKFVWYTVNCIVYLYGVFNFGSESWKRQFNQLFQLFQSKSKRDIVYMHTCTIIIGTVR